VWYWPPHRCAQPRHARKHPNPVHRLRIRATTAQRCENRGIAAPHRAARGRAAPARARRSDAADRAHLGRRRRECARGRPAALGAASPPEPTPAEPFAFADFTWLTGNARNTDAPLATRYITPDIRVDVNYTSQFHHPKDDTISGSSEIFRSDEFQLTQLGVGGDFLYDHVRARLQTQLASIRRPPRATTRARRAAVESRQRLPLRLRGLRWLPL